MEPHRYIPRRPLTGVQSTQVRKSLVGKLEMYWVMDEWIVSNTMIYRPLYEMSDATIGQWRVNPSRSNEFHKLIRPTSGQSKSALQGISAPHDPLEENYHWLPPGLV